jgi:RimJ/RimL family protein N-acetyltransferase
VDDDGNLIGGCAFTLYTGAGGSITVHVAGDRGWVSRTLIVTLFHYVFGVADCRKVFAPVHETNAQMLAILPRMGFRAEHTVLDVYPGEQRDLILFGMYKHECRWLRYPLRGAGSGVVFHG